MAPPSASSHLGDRRPDRRRALEQHVDEPIGQVVGEAGLDVGAQAMGEQVVGDRLHEQEGHDRQVARGRLQIVPDPAQHDQALLGVTRPFDQRHDAGPADELRRHPRHVVGAPQEARPQQLVARRGVGHLTPAALDHLARVGERVEGGQDEELRQFMQRELELGDDAEVAAAATQRPEQFGVLVR